MDPDLGQLDDWRWLVSGEGRELVEHASLVRQGDVGGIEKLRRLGSAERVRLALGLAEARRRAAGRIDNNEELVADPIGVQMASATDAARHKAERFSHACDDRAVLDLCCGIGGDAIGLARAGSVEVVDRSEVRAWMAEENVRRCGSDGGDRVRARVADVEDVEMHGRFVHLDPLRRGGGKRRLRIEDLEPGLGFIRRACTEAQGAAIKLGPGVDSEDLPSGELEYISRRGRMNQAVLWTGELARFARSATMIDGESDAQTVARDLGAQPESIGVGEMGRFVHSVDPAIERAGLLGEFGTRTGLCMLHPRVGLFTGDVAAPEIEGASTWLTSFSVRARMGWRTPRVREWLRAHDGGVVEIKTRGGACDPDRVQRELRGTGDTGYVVFVLRFGERVEALIAERT